MNEQHRFAFQPATLFEIDLMQTAVETPFGKGGSNREQFLVFYECMRHGTTIPNTGDLQKD